MSRSPVSLRVMSCQTVFFCCSSVELLLHARQGLSLHRHQGVDDFLSVVLVGDARDGQVGHGTAVASLPRRHSQIFSSTRRPIVSLILAIRCWISSAGISLITLSVSASTTLMMTWLMVSFTDRLDPAVEREKRLFQRLCLVFDLLSGELLLLGRQHPTCRGWPIRQHPRLLQEDILHGIRL